jgi:ERCC4-type nuclease
MIFVDDRSGSVELAPFLSCPHTICRMAYGDFSLLGSGPGGLPISVGVERKAILDLIKSMTEGRLSGHQLIGLFNTYSKVYLLVEGMWRSNPSSGLLERWNKSRGWHLIEFGRRRFTYREIVNYLNTLSVMCGVMVWQTAGMADSARWLTDLHAWWNKPFEDHHSHLQFHNESPVGAFMHKPPAFRRMVKELSDVGWKKSEQICGWFGTMERLMNATEGDLKKIPGVGSKMAAQIWKELHGNGRIGQ